MPWINVLDVGPNDQEWPLASMPATDTGAPYILLRGDIELGFGVCRLCGSHVEDGYLRAHWSTLHGWALHLVSHPNYEPRP